MKHPIKAAAIDLDGTLLGPDLAIGDENRAAVESLHRQGVQIILASGRHHTSMLPYAKSLPQVEWMISSQGAFAANVSRSIILHDNKLEPERAGEAIDAGLQNGYDVIAYTRDGICALSSGEWIDYYISLAGITPPLVDREHALRQSIFKVVLLGTEQRIDEAAHLSMTRNWDLYKVRSLKNIYEFAAHGTSKAHGLRPLLQRLGIAPSELAAFGDAPNDVPMFELAGFSVAMDHAWPAAKAAATAVAPKGEPESSFARAVGLL